MARSDQAWIALAFAGLCFVPLFLALRQKQIATQQARAATSCLPLIERHKDAWFIITKDHQILARNTAAQEQEYLDDNLGRMLRDHILDGDDHLQRLVLAAGLEGHITDIAVTRRSKFELSVTQLEHGLFSCCLHKKNRSARLVADGPELPMLTVAASGTILFVNQAARNFLGGRQTSLQEIFADDPVISDVNQVRTKQGIQPCFVLENALSGGRKEIFLIPALGKRRSPVEMSFENMPVAVLKIDESGAILSANKTALKLMGPEARDRRHLQDVMEGLGRPMADWLREASQGRTQTTNEFLRLKRDDKESFVQVTLGRAFDADGTTLYAIFHDATELKTLEAQFVQSQKMQAIGQLAGGVAHDFNNLLTAISGHCDLLLVDRDSTDPSFNDLMQIHQNANRAAALVGQLLAYSRKQTLQPTDVDLRETLDELTHLLNRLVGENVNLQVQASAELDTVYLDPQQFEQVIMNLVVNARDAMPDGGDVIVRTENYHIQNPTKRGRAMVPAGDYVCVQVIDQGKGISKDRQDMVFEPFYTTKATGEGTGLGLSTAYGIVKQSGGYIFLDSTEGQGAQFSLLFPKAAKQSPVFVRSPAANRKQEPMDGTVLLVEDEAPVRAFASRALKMKGFSVLEAENGEAALEILKDPGLAVDLFLTDVAMPGLDGPSWVKQALEDRADTHVVFISGYAEEKFAQSAAPVPNAVFLPKPFSLEELTSTVRRQISAASRETVV